MELDIVDKLLICLVDQSRNASMAMRDLGYTQDQISQAWRETRRLGYTESLGLERTASQTWAELALARSRGHS